MDDTKQPSGVMVNAEGEWVVAEPDQASWDQYQAKAKVSAAAQQAAALGSKELQDRGLECSIDKRLFVDPTKTPCCNTTYCNDCITNSLLDSGLTCPNCGTEDVVLDHLLPDEETAAKLRTYQEEKDPRDAKKESAKSPVPKSEPESDRPTSEKSEVHDEESKVKTESKNSSPKPENSSSGKATTLAPSPTPSNSKKRPAETELKNDRTPLGPAATAMAKQSSADGSKSNSQSSQSNAGAPNAAQYNQTPFANGNYMMGNGTNAMAFPNMNGMNGFPGLPMNSGVYNPAMMGNNGYMNTNPNWNMWGQGYPQNYMAMSGAGYQNGMYSTAGYNMPNMPMPMANGYSGMNNTGSKGYGKGSFPNQQRNHFQGSNDEDSAYFRKPVNPHRGRRNLNRPTDYREI